MPASTFTIASIRRRKQILKLSDRRIDDISQSGTNDDAYDDVFEHDESLLDGRWLRDINIYANKWPITLTSIAKTQAMANIPKN